MRTVTVVDYGMGNLLSVTRAFEHCGATVLVTDDASKILAADYLILPGVGAFADGMKGLSSRGLVDPLKEFAAKGRPFLGICLGMQMMLDESEEFGASSGLSLIAGKVKAIPSVGADGLQHKIPHIGWNQISPPESISWDGTILGRTANRTSFYFVHSFAAQPDNPAHRLADCYYNGIKVSAVINNLNLYGCQFHPEKSGRDGLNVLKCFLEM